MGPCETNKKSEIPKLEKRELEKVRKEKEETPIKYLKVALEATRSRVDMTETWVSDLDNRLETVTQHIKKDKDMK